MPEKNTQEIPVFVHTSDDDYVDAPISSKALDEVIQWAMKWTRSSDQGVAKRAQSAVKSLESFLEALDQKSKEIDDLSGGDPYLAGLLGQAEAMIAKVPKRGRVGKSRA